MVFSLGKSPEILYFTSCSNTMLKLALADPPRSLEIKSQLDLLPNDSKKKTLSSPPLTPFLLRLSANILFTYTLIKH